MEHDQYDNMDKLDEYIYIYVYLGLIMTLIFIDERKSLVSTTFLASKAVDPKQKDYNNAMKILNYVVCIKNRISNQ